MSARTPRSASPHRGVKVVGISDHTIACYDPKGFDVRAAVRACRAATAC